tara:strand:- start:464 stop:664 length:201 start_codon:yes stop_codon:yes gene_type:complete
MKSINENENKTTVPIPIPPPPFIEDYDDITLVRIIESEIKLNNLKSARKLINCLEERKRKSRKNQF